MNNNNATTPPTNFNPISIASILNGNSDALRQLQIERHQRQLLEEEKDKLVQERQADALKIRQLECKNKRLEKSGAPALADAIKDDVQALFAVQYAPPDREIAHMMEEAAETVTWRSSHGTGAEVSSMEEAAERAKNADIRVQAEREAAGKTADRLRSKHYSVTIALSTKEWHFDRLLADNQARFATYLQDMKQAREHCSGDQDAYQAVVLKLHTELMSKNGPNAEEIKPLHADIPRLKIELEILKNAILAMRKEQKGETCVDRGLLGA